MAQLMPLPLTVSCFSKIQIGFTFLVPAYPGSPGQRAVKRECVCVCVCLCVCVCGKLLCNGRVSVRLRSIDKPASKHQRRAAGLLQHERGRRTPAPGLRPA